MAFATLERSPPPFFRQGPSAAARLVFYAALSLLAMALDARWHLLGPLRLGIDVVVAPVVEVARSPWLAWQALAGHTESLERAQSELALARQRNLELALAAQRAADLDRQNAQLRQLLQLRAAVPVHASAAQIVAQARDPFSRKLLLDRGATAGIEPGSPVIDAHGLLGQVTMLSPLGAQVTLITDRDSAVPVEVARNRARGVLVGDAGTTTGGLQLLWQANDGDLRPGDVLVTSGLDGVYPAGLAVARIDKVRREPDSAFARVLCTPLAHVDAGRYVLVLTPQRPLAPPPKRPAPAAHRR
ncbi:MAG: rod shape-determining protein MreC [Betaproteobacteria bacterium]|nr:rod shape-determining protein MreC [Betaproteobacteria bacterium]MBU6513182.1 rod shape-determining protein MreC [Betaproteobacteria bacterium]MDE2477592.1 rod shape-determining protein MreC [Betaproteobacteria bacterium]